MPTFNLKAPILAPPLTKNYGLMGTAFDYLLRFHLKRLYPKAIEKRWVAEQAVNLLKDKLIDSGRLNRSQTESLREIRAKGEGALEKAKKEYADFLASGILTDNLLYSVIQLARLDAIYRAGYLDPNLGFADPHDISDLRHLFELIPSELFAGRTNVFLNPTFPVGSELVKGADCDVILDGELIDFKATKFLELREEYWVQLLGYAVLADLAFSVNKDFPRPKSVGIYFCRHGVVWTYSIRGFYEHSTYPEFRGWFVEQAQQMFAKNPR